MNEREELLLRMYDQLWNNINRQILIVWQSLSALVGTIALLILGKKDMVDFDLAVTLILLISAWQIAHVYDSSLWCNRNLAMIGNIERTFLVNDDLERIHFYFKKAKSKGMIGHLVLQLWFGIVLTFVVLLYHFLDRVLPGMGASFLRFEPERAIPYIFLVCVIFFLFKFQKKCLAEYAEFLEKSPGPEIKNQV